MLHNVTTSILNLSLDMLGDMFCFFFYVNDYCVLLIRYLLFTIIIYCVCAMFFLAFCVLSSWLSLSVTLSIHTYAYFIVMKNQTHGLWLEAVAWTRRHCHYFFLFFWFSLLNILHI